MRPALPETLSNELFALRQGVTAEDVERFNQSLKDRFPDAELPLARQLTVVALERVAPLPCLRFTSRPMAKTNGSAVQDLLLLSFDYNGHRISDDQACHHFDGEQVVRIERDQRREQHCVERLRAAGLEPGYIPGPAGELESAFRFPQGAPAWFDFQLNTLPQLQRDGWRIEFDPQFRNRLVQVERWHGRLKPRKQQNWFDLALGIEVEGEWVNLLPPLVTWLRQFSSCDCSDGAPFILPLPNGANVSIPPERIRHIVEILFELQQGGALDERGRLPLNWVQLARLTELVAEEAAPITWSGSEALIELTRQLRSGATISKVAPPTGLRASLRDYQQQGLDWLQFLRKHRLAGVLADDMGLGKTLQILAHLLLEKQRGRMDSPSLVIAPTSLLFNWRQESRRFAPELRVLLLHGPARHERFREIAGHDLVLTSYPLLVRDRDRLQQQAFHLLILDEAQIIKNPKTQASRVVRILNSRHRLCLTGTPLENHLGELWSLFDFLLPGLLGGERQFQQQLRDPVEKRGDAAAVARLTQRLRPFMLRRSKQEVARELPPRSEIVRTVALDGGQRELYESIRLAMHQRVREALTASGRRVSRLTLLDVLLKLRQVCCDPRLVKLEQAHSVKGSAKLELLLHILPEMIEEGRRVLLFSQFTEMLELIERAVRRIGIDYVKLTGRTRDRALPVERFQQREVALFLISLKAGGMGLNLTAADSVIHYDPWWNPAVERQAADRAHRIGQQHPVFVYKLICEGTVEEKIHQMQLQKQALFDSLFSPGGGGVDRWTEAELEMLLGPLQ